MTMKEILNQAIDRSKISDKEFRDYISRGFDLLITRAELKGEGKELINSMKSLGLPESRMERTALLIEECDVSILELKQHLLKTIFGDK